MMPGMGFFRMFTEASIKDWLIATAVGGAFTGVLLAIFAVLAGYRG